MKRLFSLVLVLLMVFTTVNAVPLTTSALETDDEYVTERIEREHYEANRELASLALDTEPTGLNDYLLDQITACEESIDISSYNIAFSDENNNYLSSLLYGEITEAFHIDYFTFTVRSSKIIRINISYNCTAEEYQDILAQINAVTDKMLSDIKSADISDVEKALLLHDRIALMCKYDYTYGANDTKLLGSSNIYGAFIEGEVVCEGYSKAYKHLLNKVGIDSYLCTSNTLNHMWNIVYIDGKPYHVDITWDDPYDYNVAGLVYHDNFLLSTSALYMGVNGSEGHVATDYDSSPVDTTYDSYFWQNSTTAFQLIDDTIYYIDNENENLMCMDTGATLCNVSDEWRANQYSYWPYNFACLGTDGENLFYSLSDSIYEYNLTANQSKVIHKPDLSVGEYYSVFGFTYKDGYLIYDLTNDANFEDKDNAKRYSVLYDVTAPKAQIATTNNVATAQNLRFTFTDNLGIAGYYWGTDSTYSNNIFVETDSTTIYTGVSDSGTYYLTVKDISGNLSATYSAVFYKTALNTGDGTVTPDYIITANGCTVTLPTPVNEGHIFMGWSSSPEGAELVTDVTPTADSTYYAIWDKEPVTLSSVTVNTPPRKTSYFVGDSLDLSGLSLLLTYSDGTTQVIYEGYTADNLNLSSAGQQLVEVSYNGFDTSFNVDVNEVKLTAVEINTLPDKTDYFTGNSLDTTGLSLLLTYNNETTKIISSGFTVSGFDAITAGTKTVTVTYMGFTDSFEVTVKAPQLISVTIHQLPDKTTYYVGETLDLTGLALKMAYDSGDTQIITQGLTSDLIFTDAGVKAVLLTVNGFELSLTVDAIERTEPVIIIPTTNAEVSSTATDAPTEAPADAPETSTSACVPTENATDPTEATSATAEPDSTTAPVEPTEAESTSSEDATNTTEDATDTSAPTEPAKTESAATEPTTSSTPDESQVLLGDVTLDGKVNIKDVTAIQKFAATLITLTDKALQAADVDRNSKVNIKDATAIQKYVAGLIELK